MTQSPAMAAYFEAAAKASGQPKMASNWIMGEVSRRLNAEEGTFDRVRVDQLELAALISRVADGTISNNAAKQLFEEMWSNVQWSEDGGRIISVSIFESVSVTDHIDALIESKGLKQMNDSGALDTLIDDVLATNAPMVEQFRAGKDKAFNALVGLVMKASKGKANPQQANDLLRQKLQ
jgi:aspartyl-tRNA(Asn)/glutamyl-tRNA(Gln) amidotransferase subunit B